MRSTANTCSSVQNGMRRSKVGENLFLKAGLREELGGGVETDEHAGHPGSCDGQQGVRVALEVDQLCQRGILYEGLVEVATDGGLGLLHVPQPGAGSTVLLLLTALQQDLDSRALLHSHQSERSNICAN